MDEKGYIVFVLNTHQPFVRHPELEYAPQENWLNEATTECYIPLIDICSRLLRDEINATVTVSFTPCLVAMLADPYRQERYSHYLEERIGFADGEVRRTITSASKMITY